MNLTNVNLDRSSLVVAQLTPAQDINASGANLNFDGTIRSEADWGHVSGTAISTLASPFTLALCTVCAKVSSEWRFADGHSQVGIE